jgi:hypothetical protein
VLSEDLAKYDGQFEGATGKIVDVLRNAYKGDESRVDNACRIADRKSISSVPHHRKARVICYELSMYAPFDWTYLGNAMKYRMDKPITDILDMLVKVVFILSSLTGRK